MSLIRVLVGESPLLRDTKNRERKNSRVAVRRGKCNRDLHAVICATSAAGHGASSPETGLPLSPLPESSPNPTGLIFHRVSVMVKSRLNSMTPNYRGS